MRLAVAEHVLDVGGKRRIGVDIFPDLARGDAKAHRQAEDIDQLLPGMPDEMRAEDAVGRSDRRSSSTTRRSRHRFSRRTSRACRWCERRSQSPFAWRRPPSGRPRRAAARCRPMSPCWRSRGCISVPRRCCGRRCRPHRSRSATAAARSAPRRRRHGRAGWRSSADGGPSRRGHWRARHCPRQDPAYRHWRRGPRR